MILSETKYILLISIRNTVRGLKYTYLYIAWHYFENWLVASSSGLKYPSALAWNHIYSIDISPRRLMSREQGAGLSPLRKQGVCFFDRTSIRISISTFKDTRGIAGADKAQCFQIASSDIGSAWAWELRENPSRTNRGSRLHLLMPPPVEHRRSAFTVTCVMLLPSLIDPTNDLGRRVRRAESPSRANKWHRDLQHNLHPPLFTCFPLPHSGGGSVKNASSQSVFRILYPPTYLLAFCRSRGKGAGIIITTTSSYSSGFPTPTTPSSYSSSSIFFFFLNPPSIFATSQR